MREKKYLESYVTFEDLLMGHRKERPIKGKLILFDTENTGPVTAAALQKKAALSTPLFNQAIGWLAREGKLNFQGSGKTLRIALATANA